MKASLKTGQEALNRLSLYTSSGLALMIDYPHQICPSCQKDKGEVFSVCRLEGNTKSVLIRFLMCDTCYEKTEQDSNDKRVKTAEQLIAFFNDWIVFEFSRKAVKA